MKIKACLFDLDGVIVDTAKYHYLAWKRLADELGFNFTKEDNEQLKGISRMASLDILLNIGKIELSQEEKVKIAAKKNEWYREYILKMKPDEILPGVLYFLDNLRKNNIKIALGSASKNAQTILKGVKILNKFDAIIDGTNVSRAKPDPEVFSKGAEALNIAPENCIVFEDAEAGIQAAINAGMNSVGIGSPEILKKASIVKKGLQGFDYKQLSDIFNKIN